VTDPTTISATPSDRDAQTWAFFLSLAVVWGSSFMFIKIALDAGTAPLTLISTRLLLGSLVLAGVMLLRGGRLPATRTGWWRMTVLAFVNIAVPMAFIAWGQQYIPSGMAGILNAMVPLFAIVLAALVLHDEPITLNRLAGLAVGFGGVVLLALPSLVASTREEDALLAVAGMFAMAMGALFYAMGAVYTRSRLNGQALMRAPDGGLRAPTALEISFGNVALAFVIITVAAIVFERPAGGIYALPPNLEAVFAIVWLGVLGTGLAYLLFFKIVERWGATRTTVVTYVIPIVAVSLGFIFLGERLRPIELVGAALIIGGVALVNARIGRRRVFGRGPAGQDA
jgi:drug/metabolite transporter (DMT)-like permease